MQQIWLDKKNCDDNLKFKTHTNWQTFVKNYTSIGSLTIPRWMQFRLSRLIEIHGFCDASESAYAAALHIRVEHVDKETDTYLLAAKTRVAPTKIMLLPRLERCDPILDRLDNYARLAKETLLVECVCRQQSI